MSGPAATAPGDGGHAGARQRLPGVRPAHHLGQDVVPGRWGRCSPQPGLAWLYQGPWPSSPEGLEEVADSGLCPPDHLALSRPAALPAPHLHVALRSSGAACSPASPSALLGVGGQCSWRGAWVFGFWE